MNIPSCTLTRPQLLFSAFSARCIWSSWDLLVFLAECSAKARLFFPPYRTRKEPTRRLPPRIQIIIKSVERTRWENNRNAHNSGAKSQEWVNSGLWLSFPLLFHLNKQGGWPDRAMRGGWGGGREGCRDWNITKERGGGERREGRERTSRRPRDGEKPAGCCAGKGRQRHPPILTLPSHHNNSSGKWPPSCTVAAIYMELIQPTYRFHHQPRWLVWPSCFTPPTESLLSFSFVTVTLTRFYLAWMEAQSRDIHSKQWK